MLETLPTAAVVYLYLLAALAGLVLGSGLNCLSWRIAHGQKWSGSQRSACPVCGHTLAAKDLVPVFSYLALKGRCRYCHTKIAPRYPITEGLLAVCFVTLLARFGLTADTLTAAILCCCLFCLSLVDLETQIIPDRFLVIPAAVRAMQLLGQGGFSTLLQGIMPGLVLGVGVLAVSLLMDKILKKDTMGGGDIKLLAVLGMYFTFPECLFLLIAACVLGISIATICLKLDTETAFPFGPALSLAAWLTLLVGEPLVGWYLSLFV